MSKVFQILKEETNVLHKEVEKLSGIDKLLNYNITSLEFNNILKKNFIAYSIAENEINRYLLDYGKDISNWILEDLDFKAPKLSKSTYNINSLNEAYGAKYVIEGSLLGGNFISKHIKKCQALDQKKDYKFYSNKDITRIQRWLDFQKELNSKVLKVNDIANITRGAKKTFKNFKIIFERN